MCIVSCLVLYCIIIIYARLFRRAKIYSQQNWKSMRPRGFAAALDFHKTLKIPLGSWEAWLEECFRVVENVYSFNCTWILLVGMTAGMIEVLGAHKKYAAAVASKFNRSACNRFRILFVALSHALAGANHWILSRTYVGYVGEGLRKNTPGHVLLWPKPGTPSSDTNTVLNRVSSGKVHSPIIRCNDFDFYVYLLHGYYITTQSEAALQLLFDQCEANQGLAKHSAACQALEEDARIAEYFALKKIK